MVRVAETRTKSKWRISPLEGSPWSGVGVPRPMGDFGAPSRTTASMSLAPSLASDALRGEWMRGGAKRNFEGVRLAERYSNCPIIFLSFGSHIIDKCASP